MKNKQISTELFLYIKYVMDYSQEKHTQQCGGAAELVLACIAKLRTKRGEDVWLVKVLDDEFERGRVE